MKNLIYVILATLMLFGCWLVVKTYSKPENLSAKLLIKEKNDNGCGNLATVRAYYSFIDPSRICGYVLECENGNYIVPMEMKKNFPFSDGERVKIGYTVVEEVGFIIDCAPPFPGPFLGAKINCIQAVKNGK